MRGLKKPKLKQFVGTSSGNEGGFLIQAVVFREFSGPAAAGGTAILMGTSRSGLTPRSSKARFWTGVGDVTTDIRLSPWPGRRSWFSAMLERSSRSVRKPLLFAV